ncbi:MAG: hypothetical protein JWO08_2338 [Verrucomicrobiaceae bacterium]|nr:hypothetical protein [Verrucomicrobiaceae bacterium]
MRLMPRMKSFSSLALLLGLCLTFLAPPRAQAEDEVTFDYFYEALAPYGTWVEVEGYGLCWSPEDVDADWSPYTEGQWVYTDAGWTWVGDEAFAGIVYHYGRWVYAVNQGWCWVPGYEWGPGWVSWRDNDEYIGWAPLPPEVVWQPDQGVGIWVDEVYNIGPSYYNFCHHRDFGCRRLRSVIIARSWNTIIIVQTANITNITFNRSSGVTYCGGVNYDRACRFSGVTIPALRLERRRDFDLRSDHKRSLLPTGQIRDNTLAVVAPRVSRTQDSHKHLPKATKIIGQNQVQHGWSGKGASGDLDSVRREMHAQVEGRTPKTDPARPVAQAELRAIPQPSTGSSVRPGVAVKSDEVRPAIPVQPIPQQPQTTQERAVAGIPFNPVQQPRMPVAGANNYTRERQDQPPQERVVEIEASNRQQQSRMPSGNRNGNDDQRQGMRGGNNGNPINTYLQRQRAEAEARNQAERQAQEMYARQQNEAAETRRQTAIQQQQQQQQQGTMERQRQERAQAQQQQMGMERQRQERSQAQQQQVAMERQRQDRAQQQQQQMAVERQRQRQERAQQAQQQALQQAASMARERERQSEIQRRPTMPTQPQIQIQPPASRDSVRKPDDNDDRRRRR